MIYRILWCLPLLLTVACAGSKSAKTTATAQVMYENLEPYRPQYPPVPKKEAGKAPVSTAENKQNIAAPSISADDTERTLQKLDTIRILNRRIKYTSGYRIQLYSGTSRDRVNSTKEQLYRLLPDAEIYTEYKQPDFKVKFGDYTDKYEVQGVFSKVKEQFPEALIIEESVNIIRKQN